MIPSIKTPLTGSGDAAQSSGTSPLKKKS
jgi:hypothetical protein